MVSMHSCYTSSFLKAPFRVTVLGAAFLAVTVTNAGAQDEFVSVSSQPGNVGDAKIAALAYHDSGAYDSDLAMVAGKAVRWVMKRAPAVMKPALVLDIDETALSNWETAW